MATNQQRREAAKRKLERQLERRLEQQKRRRRIGAGVVGVAVLVVAGVVVWVVSANGGDDTNAAASPSATPTPEIQIPTQRTALPKRPTPLPAKVSCEYKADSNGAVPKKVNTPSGTDVPATGTVSVKIKTTAGDIGLNLDRALAPCTVNSFVSLVQQKYYDNTLCHRLGTQEGLQMLQCGDPSATDQPGTGGTGGPGYTIPDEVFDQLTYGRGLIAMANTGKPNTGGSQFFMMYGSTQLPPQYTVFGSIDDEGLKVLDKVARAGIGVVGQDGSTGSPKTPVKFTGVTVG